MNKATMILRDIVAKANATDAYCTIDPVTRAITVPDEYKILGVVEDVKVKRVSFKCPKTVENRWDLTTLQLEVKFENANGDVDVYLVTDVAETETGDEITFSWELSAKVTFYEGTVKFGVRALRVDTETGEKERVWNTTDAESQVLNAIRIGDIELSDENADIVIQLLQIMKETSEQTVNDVKNTGDTKIQEIETAKTDAIEEATTAIEQATTDAKNQAIASVNETTTQKLAEIEKAKTQSVTTINETTASKIEDIESAKNTAVEEAKNSISETTDTKIQEIETAKTDAIEEATTAIEQKGQEALDSIPDTYEELEQQIEKIPYTSLEQSINMYYALRRNGKVYQTKLWKFATNPTSSGEKLLDNSGLVFEPSTDTEEGQDDYLNGQHPLFEWINVNYIRDDDGAPRPIAIEGMPEYKTSGSVDVGAMQMSFWLAIDASNPEYDLVTISNLPNEELGLKPWPNCVKADGTILPWCITSKYFSGIASDGLLRSQPRLKPERKQSNNNMITNYQKKGPGYWGAGCDRQTFQFVFNAIKGATKNSQTLFSGVTDWNFQYDAAVQSSEKHAYFPVTNSQANYIVVGGYVSVGYGYNSNETLGKDRGNDAIHAYADDVKVLAIETLDENNKKIILDISEENAFDTMPVTVTDTLTSPIILTSMHAWSGWTDSVIGRHDGSPVNNKDGKHPYRVQGVEYAVGGYVVCSDTVSWQNEDGTRTIYSAKRGTPHSSNDNTIKSTYKNIGTIPVHSGGSAADYWIGDEAIDLETAAMYPCSQGSGSSQGVGDYYYAGGTGANTMREFLVGGYLGGGSSAGVSCLALWNWLGDGGWHFLACD